MYADRQTDRRVNIVKYPYQMMFREFNHNHSTQDPSLGLEAKIQEHGNFLLISEKMSKHN